MSSTYIDRAVFVAELGLRRLDFHIQCVDAVVGVLVAINAFIM